jgi:hypothetical protein
VSAVRHRPITKFQPEVERFEAKRLLNASSAGAAVSSHAAGADVRKPTSLPHSFFGFRVTNTPHDLQYKLYPPFQQVLVQAKQPVPGQVYNVLQVAVKNGTGQTFTASNGFTVKVPGSRQAFPILTGTQQWKPQQVIVFYILTKKYYLFKQVPGGFMFDLGGRSSTLIPGPSGIFLRLKYNPTTFARTLNWIVAFGQGNQLGQGSKFGLPNTSINMIVAASTQRRDFGGHF